MTDDTGDDDIPIPKRESHFNNQRSSLRSSLRSDTSAGPLNRSQTRSDLQRLDDFDLDLEKAQADRTDSEAPPSPSSAASPAPNVPYARSRGNSDTKRPRRIAKRTSRSTAGSRAGDGRAVDDLSAPESWLHVYDLNAHSPNLPPSLQTPRTNGQSRRAESVQAQTQRSRRPSHSFPGQAIGIPGIASDSQVNITALPSMGEEKELEGAAKYYGSKPTPRAQRLSQGATELYTVSYLIFFAIWGSLARVGLQALTFYPGAPVVFSELWANVAGTLFMGFLAEDRKLFRSEWGHDGESVPEPLDRPAEFDAAGYHKAKARHGKIKKTIPIYIGLATGFCGSFTSFSSFIRDVFLSLSNDLRSPINHPYPANAALPSTSDTISRNGGYSFMAICATIIITISACYSALKVGSHLAILLDPYTPTLPFRFTRRVADPLFVFLGWGTWLGAVLMAIFPPHNAWRGQAIFACVFAPLGCLIRYYLSIWLNPMNPSFPLGTFTVNVFGTAVLGMAYDLQHVSLSTTGLVGGSLIGCQVLQGIQDGFCGALTTVSTWISEIDALKRRRAYVYGVGSVVASLGLLVIIMGSVRWTVGWQAIICKT
ncbi:chromosome condensation protein-like protein [Plenodomus tracheiphilus IPT5]|uniref:Chromosome condensation protein-like protein n=1 Tax=Plenodomus tracheiphilus IPT5 TaxID=1408161 RepID=A0A6A7B7T8_9PLEO|nr:chromosome condensation protein-like protein [Plenodomus tracheiphilus IPT5]